MSEDALTIFADISPRETGGSLASNRFDFQKNWSLCKLMELHKSHEDYLMIFEYHDDIVVFDSEDSATRAKFYQIKSKSKDNWTLKSLTKSKKTDPSNSILGKLFSNHKKFNEIAEKLIFVSNQPLSTKLANGEKSIDAGTVDFSQLDTDAKETLHKALEPDCDTVCDLNGLKKIRLEKCNLPHDGHDQMTRGQLVEFFDEVDPTQEVHISLIYKTFFDEIRRKSNFEGKTKDKDSLVTNRAISRSKFSQMVSEALNRRTDQELWSDTERQLQSEGCSYSDIKSIRKGWNAFIIDKMDATNEHLLQFIKTIYSLLKLEPKPSSLKGLAFSVLDNMRTEKDFSQSDYYIIAATIYGEMKDDPIPKTNTKPKEETK